MDLKLGLSITAPFFHCTETPGLESSQRNMAVLPSSASWFWSSSEKNNGFSGEGKQNHICFYMYIKKQINT